MHGPSHHFSTAVSLLLRLSGGIESERAMRVQIERDSIAKAEREHAGSLQ